MVKRVSLRDHETLYKGEVVLQEVAARLEMEENKESDLTEEEESS